MLNLMLTTNSFWFNPLISSPPSTKTTNKVLIAHHPLRPTNSQLFYSRTSTIAISPSLPEVIYISSALSPTKRLAFANTLTERKRSQGFRLSVGGSSDPSKAGKLSKSLQGREDEGEVDGEKKFDEEKNEDGEDISECELVDETEIEYDELVDGSDPASEISPALLQALKNKVPKQQGKLTIVLSGGIPTEDYPRSRIDTDERSCKLLLTMLEDKFNTTLKTELSFHGDNQDDHLLEIFIEAFECELLFSRRATTFEMKGDEIEVSNEGYNPGIYDEIIIGKDLNEDIIKTIVERVGGHLDPDQEECYLV